MTRNLRVINVAVTVMWLFVACDGAIDRSNLPSARTLVGRCVELDATSFVVMRTDMPAKHADVTRFVVAPPGTLFAPVTRVGSAASSRYGKVVGVMPRGSRMRIERVWLLKRFEGATVAPTAVWSNREVDITFLLSERGLVALLDSIETGERLGTMPLLNESVAHFCEDHP